LFIVIPKTFHTDTPSSAAVAVALGVIPVLGFIHGSITTGLRKAAKVPYPHCYATVEQCKENVSSPDHLISSQPR
jgi:hypothetical protein